MQQLLLLLSFSLSRNISSNKRGAQEGPELLRRRNGNFFLHEMSSKGKEFHFGKYFSIYYVRLLLMYFSFFFLCFHDSIATTAKSNLLEAASICLRAADDKKKKSPTKNSSESWCQRCRHSLRCCHWWSGLLKFK